jgi:FtsZ-interacting cell division protein YlmF
MAKKFMGKFLNILGFEDQETGEMEPQRDEPQGPYGGIPTRNAAGSGSGSNYQRPPTRRRMDEQGMSQQTGPIPTSRRSDEGRVVPMSSSSSSNNSAAAGIRMVVYQPQSYDDTQRIIDDLKSGRPVIANLEDLNVDIAQRVLDFLSGAVYGIDGSIRKVSRGIFLLAPPHVDISGNALGSLTSDLRAGRGSYFNLPRRPE